MLVERIKIRENDRHWLKTNDRPDVSSKKCVYAGHLPGRVYVGKLLSSAASACQGMAADEERAAHGPVPLSPRIFHLAPILPLLRVCFPAVMLESRIIAT